MRTDNRSGHTAADRVSGPAVPTAANRKIVFDGPRTRHVMPDVSQQQHRIVVPRSGRRREASDSRSLDASAMAPAAAPLRRRHPAPGPVVVVLLIACLAASATAAAFSPQRQRCRLVESLRSEIASYRPVVDSVLSYVRGDGYKGRTWTELANFTDKFGYRLAGTENLEASIDYMQAKLAAEGLDNVHTERVQFTGWQRYSLSTLHRTRF